MDQERIKRGKAKLPRNQTTRDYGPSDDKKSRLTEECTNGKEIQEFMQRRMIDDGPNKNKCIPTKEETMINDAVHGSIVLNGVLIAIIDTPQFQRLRDIKQLGASYWVYPGACHNRFEHSIGTSYLCGKMIRKLKERHTDLITEKEVLCIEIAGLCHDLGHGPFSHVFDTQYKKLVAPESEWSHEQGSIDMFDYILKENLKVKKVFDEAGIGEDDIQLVKDLIMGKDPKHDDIKQDCNFEGQKMKKWFLYEIVSNKINGIDCDKFDYLIRDSHYVGTKNNFDCLRYFQTTQIIPVDGQLQICVRDKEYLNIYELFHTRWSLHHRVYQHKTTKIVEEMFCEALAEVDRPFNIFGSTGDMKSYTLLTDSIINEICKSNNDDEATKKAKEIIHRIQTRDLYKLCGQVNVRNCEGDVKILEKGEENITKEISGMNSRLGREDIIVRIISISFGMKQKDPIESVIFFDKDGQPKKIKKDHISQLLPQQFEEKYIRVYCRNPSKKDMAKECFQEWCKKNKLDVPDLLYGDTSGYFTDAHKSDIEKKMKMEDRQMNLDENSKVRRSISFQE